MNFIDYKKKYLKYKKKYLKLKGGASKSPNISQETIFLSGPVSAFYRSNGNKRIILLSDIHETTDACEYNQIEIDKYLRQLFENSDYNIDFFIEEDWYKIKNNLDNLDELKNEVSEIDWINKIVKLSLQYYNLKDNTRIHFSDIRNKSLSLKNLNEPLNELINLVKPKDITIDFKDNFFKMYKQYITILYNFIQNTRKYNETSFNLENKILKKEILKLEKIIGKNKLQEIFNLINQKIIKLFDVIFNEETNLSLNEYQHWGFYIITPYTYIGELYTLARLMKPEFKNIIIYEGQAHIQILNEYLNILEFNLDHSFHEITPNCLNLIPFENYLLKN